MTRLEGVTSERHSEMLDGLMTGDTNFYEWARDALGDIRLVSWEYGALRFRWKIGPDDVLPDGVMFGGQVAAAGDFITSVAALSVFEENDERMRTSQLQVSYFRPIKAPSATIEARVTNISKRLIHVEADILNAEGKLAMRVSAVEVRRRADDGQKP